MKRTITLLLVAFTLGVASPAEAFEMRHQCRYRMIGGPSWSYQNVHDTAQCAARKNGLNVDWFLSIVSCESGFQAFPEGFHHGPMQYVASTFHAHYGYFPDYVRWHRLYRDADRPRANIMVAARYMDVYNAGPWSCA